MADNEEHVYIQEMGVSDEEIERRKQWLEFSEEDEARIKSIGDLAQKYRDEVIEDLYRHFLAFPEVAAFFEEEEVLEHVKAMQRDYFVRLTGGDYDRDYVEDRLKIGAVHERVGVDVKWYLGAYNHYMRFIARKIFESFPDDRNKAFEVYMSLNKLIFLDIGLAIDTYIFQRERTIRMQQEALQELSAPVLQLREGLLLLPLVGVIDSRRAMEITSGLLNRIREARARMVVLDVTGVPAMDSQVANHLIQTVEAARLMGAQTILTGLSAETSQTLVTLGVNLREIRTAGDLQDGIEEAERTLGFQVVHRSDGGETAEEGG